MNGITAFFITFVRKKEKLMKKNLYIVCLCGILLSVTACTSLQPFSYERLQPADVNFPGQIRKVGIVNNMPPVHQDYKQVDYKSASLEGDGDVATEAFAQEVVSVGYFDEVVLYDQRIRKTTNPLELPIPKQTTDDLIRKLDVDMLLSMERVNVELKESFMFVPGSLGTVPAVDGVVTSVVRAYLKQREEPLFTIQKTDTLCWEITPKLSYGDVIKDVSEYAAILPMQNLLPYWVEVERYYYDGGNVEMRDAGVFVREESWEEAAALWEKVYQKKKGKAKMRAAYNLAVYSERKNDFDRAKEYLDTAYGLSDENSFDQQLILIYRMRLEDECQKNLRLNVQMKRFEP